MVVKRNVEVRFGSFITATVHPQVPILHPGYVHGVGHVDLGQPLLLPGFGSVSRRFQVCQAGLLSAVSVPSQLFPLFPG